MKEPYWLNKFHIINFHAQQIHEHGGMRRAREVALLESALARPQHLFHYNASSKLHDLAASYGYGIIKNHPFIDGNKRTGIITSGVFLLMNNYLLEVPEPEMVIITTDVAAGKISEKDFGYWLKENIQQRIKK